MTLRPCLLGAQAPKVLWLANSENTLPLGWHLCLFHFSFTLDDWEEMACCCGDFWEGPWAREGSLPCVCGYSASQLEKLESLYKSHSSRERVSVSVGTGQEEHVFEP